MPGPACRARRNGTSRSDAMNVRRAICRARELWTRLWCFGAEELSLTRDSCFFRFRVVPTEPCTCISPARRRPAAECTRLLCGQRAVLAPKVCNYVGAEEPWQNDICAVCVFAIPDENKRRANRSRAEVRRPERPCPPNSYLACPTTPPTPSRPPLSPPRNPAPYSPTPIFTKTNNPRKAAPEVV
jgi:hypothetical protein